MKFVHAADLHLDQAFEGLGLLPEEFSDKLTKTNEIALALLVDKAIAEKVDFVLLVGDTFHHPQVTIQTQTMFLREMERLNHHDILMILSFGNHDYYSENSYWFDFPKNVILFKEEKIGTVEITCRDGSAVAISGFSYNHRWLEGNMLSDFPNRKMKVDYHIGFYHGQTGQNQYGSFSVEEALEKGYDYWALGHIHQPQVIYKEPMMIYPGSLTPHTQKEKNSGSFVLVDFEGETPKLDWYQTRLISWETKEFSADKMENMQDLLAACLETFNSQQTGFKFVKIKLSNASSELKAILTDVKQKKGLLHYLQTELFRKGPENLWLYDLFLGASETKSGYSLPISEEWLDKLVKDYLDEELFRRNIQELYKNNLSAQLLAVSDDKKEELMTQAEERFKQVFSMKSGDAM